MGRSHQAIINPELLVWAHTVARLKLEEVARKLRIKVEKLQSWEAGESRPTVNQLRELARIYNQSFAAFYLPRPSQIDFPVPHDYRRHAGTTSIGLSSELALDLRTSWERRQVIIDLYTEQGIPLPKLAADAVLESDPVQIGIVVRDLLRISYEIQRGWRETRIAFNQVREAIEETGGFGFPVHEHSDRGRCLSGARSKRR